MTAQIQDTVEYKGETYLLIDHHGKSPFDPERYGLEVTGKSSICWRGYACTYRIEKNIIQLDTLEASVGRYEGAKYVELELPRINNVEGERQESTAQVFNAKYEHLHLQLPFSGTLILAKDYSENLGQPIGMETKWMFNLVLALTFKDGILKEVKDISKEMELIRKQRIKNLLG